MAALKVGQPHRPQQAILLAILLFIIIETSMPLI